MSSTRVSEAVSPVDAPYAAVDLFVDWEVLSSRDDAVGAFGCILDRVSALGRRVDVVSIARFTGASEELLDRVDPETAAGVTFRTLGMAAFAPAHWSIGDDLLRLWKDDALAELVVVATREPHLLESLTFFVTLEGMSPERLLVVSDSETTAAIRLVLPENKSPYRRIAERAVAMDELEGAR